ncbi:DUF6025 family protein [Cytobacillus firmus]|uniref:DUF6025 family protein n=1 Tax=Cytobacillus firmus TaxID=1399 RepID=UPI0018CE06A2|nr:DUF6025 family protein [Cytobacillus firmus]MBG9590195.1 hypothetical protein [Cytobacillus firmus]
MQKDTTKSNTETKFPIEVLLDLGVLRRNKKGVLKGVFKEHSLTDLIERKEGFDWIHMGVTDIKIGDLQKVLKEYKQLVPPRTGHMGNWEDIANGRAGMIDYNKSVITDLKLGYPLIYSNNQTEDSSMLQGDWIYLPGSKVQYGKKEELELFSFDGTEFIKRDRNSSYFTPFMLTKIENTMTPLTSYHWENMKHLVEFKFRMFDSLVVERWDLVSSILQTLVQYSLSEQLFGIGDIFAHQVTLSGEVNRSDINYLGNNKFKVGNTLFESANELISASMLPLLAVSNPNNFFNNIATYPKNVPVISKSVTTMLFAILNTHIPTNTDNEANKLNYPFSPHFHWGALSLGGYPPYKKGTFSNKDNIRLLKEMKKVIIENYPEINPSFFVILPAAPLTIFPTSAQPGDHEYLRNLVSRVQQNTVGLENKPNLMLKAVEATVTDWLNENKGFLSEYFLNKFTNRRSVLNSIDLPEYSEIVEYEEFSNLTFKQGCMIVGSLLEKLNDKN